MPRQKKPSKQKKGAAGETSEDASRDRNSDYPATSSEKSSGEELEVNGASDPEEGHPASWNVPLYPSLSDVRADIRSVHNALPTDNHSIRHRPGSAGSLGLSQPTVTGHDNRYDNRGGQRSDPTGYPGRPQPALRGPSEDGNRGGHRSDLTGNLGLFRPAIPESVKWFAYGAVAMGLLVFLYTSTRPPQPAPVCPSTYGTSPRSSDDSSRLRAKSAEERVRDLHKLRRLLPSELPSTFWSKLAAQTSRILSAEGERPAVILLRCEDRSFCRALTECVARWLAYSVTATGESEGYLHIPGDHREAGPGGTKYSIDTQLGAFFGRNGARVALFTDVQQMEFDTAALFFKYCDHVHAPYKSVIFLMTVTGEGHSAEDIFRRAWSEERPDSLQPLLSRIVTNEVAVSGPAPSTKAGFHCPSVDCLSKLDCFFSLSEGERNCLPKHLYNG